MEAGLLQKKRFPFWALDLFSQICTAYVTASTGLMQMKRPDIPTKLLCALMAYGETRLERYSAHSDIVNDVGIVGDDFLEFIPFLKEQYGDFDAAPLLSRVPDEGSQLSILLEIRRIGRIIRRESEPKTISLREIDELCRGTPHKNLP
ncbi:MAG: hypothetical protein OEZ19_03885 [Paracoccaceae bacterium]|nr:hypothetical protein [Paracoccaceae bacterium]